LEEVAANGGLNDADTVAVTELVDEDVLVCEAVDVEVGVYVRVGDCVFVCEEVCEGVNVSLRVWVGEGVLVAEVVMVAGVDVEDGVLVDDAVDVGVLLGDAATPVTVSSSTVTFEEVPI
jgi:hypothetical protein